MPLKTWKEIFCDKKNKDECVPEDAFKNAIIHQDVAIDNNIKEVTAYLEKSGYVINSKNFAEVISSDGKKKKTQDILSEINEKNGFKGNIDNCYKNPHKMVKVHGHDKTCGELENAITSQALSDGLTPTSKWMEFTDGNKVVSGHIVAKRMDRNANPIVKKYQQIIDKKNAETKLVNSIERNFNDAILKRNAQNPPKKISSLVKELHIDSNYHIAITNDPVEIALKSTGRPWENESCERISGCHYDGFIDDIQYGNLIVFIVDNSGNPVGRSMIRWGNDKNNKVCAGLEPIFYTKGVPSHILDKASDIIKDYIGKTGLLSDECITPYKYRGYSDQMEKAGVEIVYTEKDDTAIPDKTPWLIYQKPSNNQGIDIANANDLSRSEIRRLLEFGYKWSGDGDAINAYFQGDYDEGWTRPISGFDDIREYIVDRYSNFTEDIKPEELVSAQEKKQVDAIKSTFGKNVDDEDERLLTNFVHNYSKKYNNHKIFYDLSGRRMFYDTNNGAFFSDKDPDYMDIVLDDLKQRGSWRLSRGEV